ncbi:MAG: hypothetical protein M0R80_27335 [Proteobacteria bacterium]|jgi:hypothetical protein|nr:hypothetical protein [Pseudomonadota bacterium]
MARAIGIRLVALFVAAAALASCAPPYSMAPPASFKRFEESREFKWITADGVMLKAREVDNYPEASLDFWADAMSRHLIAQGYIQKGERRCFDTTRGRKACTVEFMLPHGAEDWVLGETLFVVEDDIVLVEAAGPYERYALVEAELAKAVESFEPRD